MQISEKRNKGPLGMIKQHLSLQKKKKSVIKEVSNVATKPSRPLPSLNDVFAGGSARAVAQATIHPLDTLKVRMQSSLKSSVKAPAKAAKPAAGVLDAAQARFSTRVGGQVRTLYKGVGSAAAGAGIAVGAYLAFYGVATKMIREKNPDLPVGAVAFSAGALAAFGSAYVKVPLAVTIRSVQAGIYPNAVTACRQIVSKAGVRGLFTGLVPTVLEDIPDMAVKFATYEMLRTAHSNFTRNRTPSVSEDLVMGGASGALAAAATTPFDVVKTRMMCDAANRPGVLSSARLVHQQGGSRAFFRGVGPRTTSNAINSALFFCLFEVFRAAMKKKRELEAASAVPAVYNNPKAVAVEASLSKTLKK